MKTKHLTLIAGAALTLMLAACGGSSSSGSASSGTDTGTGTTTPGTSMIDTFTQYVLNLISAGSDTAEPQAIDSVTVTAPETTEPANIS